MINVGEGNIYNYNCKYVVICIRVNFYLITNKLYDYVNYKYYSICICVNNKVIYNNYKAICINYIFKIDQPANKYLFIDIYIYIN